MQRGLVVGRVVMKSDLGGMGMVGVSQTWESVVMGHEESDNMGLKIVVGGEGDGLRQDGVLVCQCDRLARSRLHEHMILNRGVYQMSQVRSTLQYH